MKNKLGAMLLGAGALASGVGIMAVVANAQTTTPTNSTAPQRILSSIVEKVRGHRPAGGDGVIASINGSTIVMAEEADEGSASYTVDATGLDISTLKVGDKVFVEGATSGNTVKATSISTSHGGHDKADAKDASGKDVETNDGQDGGKE